jgi:hypothetical protein
VKAERHTPLLNSLGDEREASGVVEARGEAEAEESGGEEPFVGGEADEDGHDRRTAEGVDENAAGAETVGEVAAGDGAAAKGPAEERGDGTGDDSADAEIFLDAAEHGGVGQLQDVGKAVSHSDVGDEPPLVWGHGWGLY